MFTNNFHVCLNVVKFADIPLWASDPGYAPGLCLWAPHSVDLSPSKESWSHELMSLRHKLSAHNQNGFSSSWTASLSIAQL